MELQVFRVKIVQKHANRIRIKITISRHYMLLGEQLMLPWSEMKTFMMAEHLYEGKAERLKPFIKHIFNFYTNIYLKSMTKHFMAQFIFQHIRTMANGRLQF